MTEFNDVMLDLETLGTTARAAVLSIGAVRFDRETGEIQAQKFHAHLDLDKTLASGRLVTADTLKWWLQQPNDSREGLLNGQASAAEDPREALCSLNMFCVGATAVWANGPAFDIAIIEDMCSQHHLYIPWRHRAVRDLRTLKDLARPYKSALVQQEYGIPHSALDDAIHQAKVVCELWAHLKKLQV